MAVRDTTAWTKILLAGAVFANPLMGLAATPPAASGDNAHFAPPGIDCHARRGPMPGPGFGGFPGGEHPWDGPPRYLIGLTLTEDQQDKVFGILHAAAPEIRSQAKALRKAHEALEELTTTAQYQEGRAKALAEVLAKADSQLALLRARSERDIYLMLTPEQRVQVLEQRRERQAHEPGPVPAP